MNDGSCLFPCPEISWRILQKFLTMSSRNVKNSQDFLFWTILGQGNRQVFERYISVVVLYFLDYKPCLSLLKASRLVHVVWFERCYLEAQFWHGNKACRLTSFFRPCSLYLREDSKMYWDIATIIMLSLHQNIFTWFMVNHHWALI